jgi:hypothetical protein
MDATHTFTIFIYNIFISCSIVQRRTVQGESLSRRPKSGGL